MTTNRDCYNKRKIVTLISAALFCLPVLSHADDDRAAAEQAKAMTLNLIQALVDSGSLTQENANKLIASAQAKARAQTAPAAVPEFRSSYTDSGAKNRESVQPAPAALRAPIPASESDVKTMAQIESQVQALTQALAQAQQQLSAQAQLLAQIQSSTGNTGAAVTAVAIAPAVVASTAATPNLPTMPSLLKSDSSDSAAEKAMVAANAAIVAADKAVAAANAATAASTATESSASNAANSAAAAYASFVANNAVVAVPPVPTPAPILAAVAEVNAAEAAPDGKRTVHVAYVPESAKIAMRDQIKQEVLAQARSEKWGDPGALPGWMRHVSFSGDVRFRNEFIKLDPTNTPAGSQYSDGVFARAANIVAGSFGGTASPFDTQHNYDFWSMRARLNVDAKISDNVTTGITLSTGNVNSHASASQNLGQNFNYYAAVISKAFIKYDPAPWFSLSAGRIGNPFFSTDLLFADDVTFEGMAATTKFELAPGVISTMTGGWFPLRMNNPGTSTGRNLGAFQAGVDWSIDSTKQFKFGAGLYDFVNVVGTAETQTDYANGVSDYGSRYEYPANFRQMGNTLFVINAPTDPNINWGLASKFKVVDLMASLEFYDFDQFHVTLISDYVKNKGFNVNDIYNRTGYKILDGKNTGYQEKIIVGSHSIKERGNWNVSLAYRYLGSDAVLDAFVNPDFGLGSTNTKGTIFTANYGIDKNLWVTGRYLSSNLIDSMVPQHAGSTVAPTKLNVDMVQVELNARF